MEEILKDKFRKLQGTQDTVVSTANYIIANSSDSRTIVKAWNQEFTNALTHEKKLTLLYLANDVLQRCKTNAFLTEFLHYIPKATAHLYKHGNKKLRTDLDRLVQVWTDRKVLRSQGIAAVRNQLAKVKATTPEDTPENHRDSTESKKASSQQGSKRKRSGHPILEALEDVREVGKKTTMTGNELQQLLGKSEISTLPEMQLISLKELSEQYCALVKHEIQTRKKTVDLLKETLNEQEEGLKKSKEMLRLCFVQQAEINKVLGSQDQTSLQQQPQSMLEDMPSLSNEMTTFDGSGHPPPLGGYPLTLMPQSTELHFGPPSHLAHPSYANNSVLQPIHPGSFFPVLHPEQPPDKPQERELANAYHTNVPYLPPEYIQECPAHQIPHYAAHVQGMHGGNYIHPLSFPGFPEQYDPEKEWGS